MQILLYKIRKEKKINQEEIAKVIHISKNQYSKKERDEAQFTQDEMFELSNFFEKPISEIFLPRKSPKWELHKNKQN
ncbi:helix-turn-helix transcriptional regulator [Streptococcus parauberis]|uniref:helix-turn-helix transcriptional regulator n=1 Tax=Streptococcus parauberis TaxID=1348 RepID=UPI0037AEF5A4